MFVTQQPQVADFARVTSAFANHIAPPASAGRGGYLYIKYPDGTLRNLTAEAGYDFRGIMKGDSAIAVRDPHIHWSGEKALFSMVVGAPSRRYEVKQYRWQIYEITGFLQGETISIRKIENQPAEYNNVNAIYGTEDQIIFVSDIPRNKMNHLYPQLDEYEATPTKSGLWSLNPVTGNFIQLNDSPSGSFHPIIDSYGRLLFTRWDHLRADLFRDYEYSEPITIVMKRISYLTKNNYEDGHYRNAIVTSDNKYIAVHTYYSGTVENIGTAEEPLSPYKFRLKTLKKVGEFWEPDEYLTSGIRKHIEYWNPDRKVIIRDTINLWELYPVEVTSRTRPTPRKSKDVEPIERSIFEDVDLTVQAVSDFLKENELALVVSRNVTQRDDADTQQPFNLKVVNSSTESVSSDRNSKTHEISHQRFFQADRVRGYSNRNGKRTLPVHMHDDKGMNIETEFKGSVEIESDGSVAAVVPAKRALAWELISPDGTPVVRERYWVTFQPGEIRLCTGCHGTNKLTQTGLSEPTNQPLALKKLLLNLKPMIKTNTDPEPDPVDEPIIPESLELYDNFPNPFNPTTNISFYITEKEKVSLKIYNILGKVVDVVFHQKEFEIGKHSISYTLFENAPSGVYFYAIISPTKMITKKMIYIK